jgi:predicted membrane chloride channel (bestrophin family)
MHTGKNYSLPEVLLWTRRDIIFLLIISAVPVFCYSYLGCKWLSVPFSALSTWMFTTMEMIGESTESPFEGSANDVPITALCRIIEIDIREMY